ncbi:hypothetical protein RRG08_016770 [Elysia crispata]|uniref:Uncharacterized protein n=1 Tax=Elysia crispata TaxID=231223 RepID=A0AAE1DPG7_9GAST|nr:hypothetical protein RRG08_016770 [Elysia crispata]
MGAPRCCTALYACAYRPLSQGTSGCNKVAPEAGRVEVPWLPAPCSVSAVRVPGPRLTGPLATGRLTRHHQSRRHRQFDH